MFFLTAFVVICVLSVCVAAVVPRRLRPIVWSVVICGGVVPWSNGVAHGHWGLVQWVPFSPTIRPRDVVLNVLLYLPFGYFLTQARRSGRGWAAVAVAVACGFVLSVATELSQVYGHGRYPSATDVMTNTAGAAIGAALARWYEFARARAVGRRSSLLD